MYSLKGNRWNCAINVTCYLSVQLTILLTEIMEIICQTKEILGNMKKKVKQIKTKNTCQTAHEALFLPQNLKVLV